MKDNSLKRDGIFAISALFGVLAAAVALVAFAYSWLGAALIGLLVGIIVAIVLWLGWRDANVQAGDNATTQGANRTTTLHETGVFHFDQVGRHVLNAD